MKVIAKEQSIMWWPVLLGGGGEVVLSMNTGTKTRTNIRNVLRTLVHITLPLLTQMVPSHALFIISSVQFSRSVVSDSLRPHKLQHTRPPCPSPTPGVHPNPHPSSQWCHPTISSSVVPFSSCPQSLPASESFPMSQLFAWGGRSTGVSALVSFLSKFFNGG